MYTIVFRYQRMWWPNSIGFICILLIAKGLKLITTDFPSWIFCLHQFFLHRVGKGSTFVEIKLTCTRKDIKRKSSLEPTEKLELDEHKSCPELLYCHVTITSLDYEESLKQRRKACVDLETSEIDNITFLFCCSTYYMEVIGS